MPPDTNECRPRREGGTQDDAANVSHSLTPAADLVTLLAEQRARHDSARRQRETDAADHDDDIRALAAQLRRRREASWRLPPLADGFRDPLDKLRSAS